MSGDWGLRLRNPDLTQGTFAEYTGVQLVERYGPPDTLQVTGRIEQLAPFAAIGAGCTLADDAGNRRFSGPLTSLQRNGDRTCVLTYSSDLIWLWGRICYPNPAQAITAQSIDYDTRTGAAETVLLAYIAANAGSGALTGRRVPNLVVPASAGRGGTTTVTARLDSLGQLVAGIAEAGSLRVTVLQAGTSLNVTVTAAPDLSATARYGDANSGGPGLLADDPPWTYTITQPTVTDVIVGGSGTGTARVFREVADSDAQALWGRIEAFLDETSTSDTSQLDQAGTQALSDGSNPVTISATVLDSPDLRIGVDVPMGAYVSLDLGGELVVDRLRQVTTTIANTSGSPTVSIVPVIGSVDAGLTRDQKTFLDLRNQLRKVVTR